MRTKLSIIVLGALAPAAASAAWSGAPLHFEVNQGQAPANTAFVARGPGFSLRLAADRAEFAAGSETVPMRIEGARAAARGTGERLLPGKSNYLLGNDQAAWRTGIALYERVRFDSVYEGIDLV